MNTNARQHIPLLFIEIISHQKYLADLLARNPVPFAEYAEANRRMREPRRAAERALHWNTDKGAVA